MRPKVMMKARPAMTGEMEKGISMRVVRKCLPRKSNLEIAQAAPRPTIVLTMTAATVAIRVRRRADRTYGVVRACT